MQEYKKTFGEVLSEIREGLGFTQTQLAELIRGKGFDVTVDTIKAWEKNDRLHLLYSGQGSKESGLKVVTETLADIANEKGKRSSVAVKRSSVAVKGTEIAELLTERFNETVKFTLGAERPEESFGKRLTAVIDLFHIDRVDLALAIKARSPENITREHVRDWEADKYKPSEMQFGLLKQFFQLKQVNTDKLEVLWNSSNLNNNFLRIRDKAFNVAFFNELRSLLSPNQIRTNGKPKLITLEEMAEGCGEAVSLSKFHYLAKGDRLLIGNSELTGALQDIFDAQARKYPEVVEAKGRFDAIMAFLKTPTAENFVEPENLLETSKQFQQQK